MAEIRFLIVAKKEFADHITSRRFLILLVVFLLFFGFTTYQGVGKFVEYYEKYASHVSERPSILSIFGFFGMQSFAFFGAIFGVVVGFDLITREKESGTLKTLLSHPVFRDEIINGKALGGFAALALVVTVAMLIVVGMVIAYGIVPSMEDTIGILRFYAITIGYFFTFFCIGLFASAVAKNTVTALLISLGLVLFFVFLLPFISIFGVEAIVGEPPEPPSDLGGSRIVISEDGVVKEIRDVTEDPRWKEYEEKSREYWKKRKAVESLLTSLSPFTNYMNLVMSYGGAMFGPEERDLTASWVSFIATPIVFLSIAYVRFLREEIT